MRKGVVMINFQELSKEELAHLEKERKEKLKNSAFIEQPSLQPLINELRFNYGFYQIGPFLINENHDKLELAIIDSEKHIYLHFIGVKEKQRGYGTKLMKLLCQLADFYQYEIILQVDETQGTPKNILETFYQRFGFVYTEEEYSEMTREPK